MDVFYGIMKLICFPLGMLLMMLQAFFNFAVHRTFDVLNIFN